VSDRCQEQVREPGTWPRYRQCSREAVKDGFCKVHHPDAKKARRDKADANYDAKHKAAMRGYACAAACHGMSDPVAEVAKLKRQSGLVEPLLIALAALVDDVECYCADYVALKGKCGHCEGKAALAAWQEASK